MTTAGGSCWDVQCVYIRRQRCALLLLLLLLVVVVVVVVVVPVPVAARPKA